MFKFNNPEKKVQIGYEGGEKLPPCRARVELQKVILKVSKDEGSGTAGQILYIAEFTVLTCENVQEFSDFKGQKYTVHVGDKRSQVIRVQRSGGAADANALTAIALGIDVTDPALLRKAGLTTPESFDEAANYLASDPQNPVLGVVLDVTVNHVKTAPKVGPAKDFLRHTWSFPDAAAMEANSEIWLKNTYFAKLMAA